MDEKLHIGLCGCGDFGKHLAQYFMEVAEVTALCDVNRDSIEDTARALALDVPHFTDYEKMFAAGRLDAVAITAANSRVPPGYKKPPIASYKPVPKRKGKGGRGHKGMKF